MSGRMSRIYVGRLPYQAREKEVERFFRGFGRIRDINLKNGFGFVELDDPRDAEDAVYELNGRELLGERVIVEHARGGGFRGGDRGGGRDDYGGGGGRGYGGRGGGGGGGHNRSRFGPPVRTDFRITVENVSSRVSWQDLKDFMRQAGEITYADAHKMRVGEGVVEYASYSDMKNALRKLDGAELNGRRIKLYEDSRRRKSSRSRSRSRDRSRRSWSRSRDRHSNSRSRSGSRSRSPRSRSRSHSKNRSASRERSKEGSRSREGSRERSVERENGDRGSRGSRSRSRSEERRERSRSRESERERSPSVKGEGSPRDEEPQDGSPAHSNEHDE